MKESLARSRMVDRGGFVLPAVIFVLVVMTTMVIAALLTAGDEQRSARAMRDASVAFYAAEAGVAQVWGTWDDTLVADLLPGDSVVLGWTTLANGAAYRVAIHRWDDDSGQPIYMLTADGKGPGSTPSQRQISVTLTAETAGAPSLGYCCNAAATVRGETKLKFIGGDGAKLSGRDTVPAGWEAACSGQLEDKPGVILADANDLSQAGGTTLEGVPPMLEDPTISDSTFDNFGGISWDSLRAVADFVIGEFGVQKRLNKSTLPPGDPYAPVPPLGPDGLPTDSKLWWIGPRYNADGTCNTDHPLNWGSKDPGDPCFNYFPVIAARGEIEIKGASYGQGVFVVDSDASGLGGEFELEGCGSGSWTENDPNCNSELNGLIIGRGCVEIQYQHKFFGAVYVDGSFPQSSCSSDRPLSIDRSGAAQYSSCAVARALSSGSLSQTAQGGSGSGGTVLLGSRAFAESLR